MPGSIERRGPNSWRVGVSNGYDEKGRKQWTRKSFKLPTGMTEAAQRRAAEKELALLVAEVERGTASTGKQTTVEAFARRWMDEHVRPNLAPKTVQHYEFLLDGRVLPALGKLKLADLKAPVINRFLNELKKDYAGTSVKKYHGVLSAMLAKAALWQVIPFSPMTGVTPPKKDTPPAKYYDEEQAARLIAALDAAPIKYRAAVMVALYGGLRLGETVGMEWSDIDIEGAHVTISRAAQYVPGKGTFTKSTKTERARDFMLPRAAVDCLIEYKAWQETTRAAFADEHHDTPRLFTQENGAPMHPDTPSQWLHKFLKRNALPPLHFHGLRHTNASILLAMGEDIVTISKRLGHAQPSITSDTYAHALKRKDKEAADKLDEAFKR